MNIGVIVVIAIAVLLVFWFVSAYNKLVRYRITAEEAFATMDVYLKKRFDLIPNLVETVKGYAGHERDTLEEIVNLRGRDYQGMEPEEKMKGDRAIGRAVRGIFALAENYPELKANENFRQLMAQLDQVEQDIANSRKYYNGAVKQYNVAVQSVPTNLVAGFFGFSQKAMFETDDPAERENVKVKF